jgi:pimeloyl-ACP methyl ester carboxylesterase
MKKNLLFFHGNGLPKSAYQEFLNLLPVNIQGPERLQNFYSIAQSRSWRPILEEVKSIIKTTPSDIIMGHSMGGVLSLWSASELSTLSPKTIIALDPVLFAAPTNMLIEMTSRLNILGKLIPEPKVALRRKAIFNDYEHALQYFKTKKVFQNFTELSLSNYIQSFVQKEDGLYLPISAKEEALVFQHMPGVPFFNLPKQHRYLWLYAADEDFVKKADITYWQKRFPHIEFIPVNASHYLPFEVPHEIVKILNEKNIL